jgi:predicted sulfurtransferase/predicted O-methyltransferase YrrM
MENGINVDPVPIPQDKFQTAGVPVNGQPAPPFRNLHIRVRHQVVADGLDKTLDWQSAGYDMPPLEWHEQLKRVKEMREYEESTNYLSQEPVPLIFDCRNAYETNVGRFEGAIPLETTNFKETWHVLKEQLADTPKDAPIMTYCTGGIRCVKVGAYLTQELGFTNVSRLAGGIVAYDRTLNNITPTEESMFKGTNFVFDGRLGRAITEDALGVCVTCGAESSLVGNCLNDWCHKRIVQCENCRTAFHGTCSGECKQRVLNGAMLARRRNNNVNGTSLTEAVVSEQGSTAIQTSSYYTIDDYSMGHSSPIPPLLDQIDFNTRAHFPTGAHMVSGAAQGRLLTELAAMTRQGRILEIGTFTGYATACLLEGATHVGRATGQWDGNRTNDGPYVMTLERKPEAHALAVAHLRIMTEHGSVGEVAAQAAQQFRGLPTTADGGSNENSDDERQSDYSEDENDDSVYQYVPKVEDPVVSLSYQGVAGCDVIRVNDALATIEAMAAGTSDIQPVPFDMVFLDADKVRLLEYAEACIASDKLLKKGGLIIVDNTLWKGLVLEASRGSYSTLSSLEDEHATTTATTPAAELRRSRRARKLATLMHRFNSAIAQDDRVEVQLLTMRDGLSIIRKKV